MLDPLKELQSISVEQCIALVENDIASGRDRYRKIPPHELALVLWSSLARLFSRLVFHTICRARQRGRVR